MVDLQNIELAIEQVCNVPGSEFGLESSQCMIVKKALCGLNSSVALFKKHIEETLYAMGNKTSYTDSDVWIQPELNPGVFEYYE